MLNKPIWIGVMLGIGGAIALTLPAGIASDTMTHDATPASETHFRTIEQPLPVRLGVTLAGLGLIGLELWWFLLSHGGRSPDAKP